MQVLGIDVGNAKVKFCWVNYPGNWDQADITWKSHPLPFSDDRQADFSDGLPLQTLIFALAHEIELADLSGVVICSSHSLSYPTFDQSVRHLAAIARATFPDTVPVWLVRADGQLTRAEAIPALADADLYTYTLTNFYGSACLGQRLIHNGLSIDIGTTTTDVIPIINGELDPVGLANPADYLRFRYQHHRINWLGLTITPLAMLTDHVPVGAQTFQIVPRDYRTDLLFALMDEADPELMREHAYDRVFPARDYAAQRLAQFVGLDAQLLRPGELAQIRDYLYGQLCHKVSHAITAVAAESFPDTPLGELEVAVFALGEQVLARPALLQAGFAPAQMRTLQLRRDQQLWSASSAFAMALRALEEGRGETLL